MVLDRQQYEELIRARIFEPASLLHALLNRRRRTIAGADGNLLILAADHTARGKISASGNALALADRFTLLSNLVTALANPGVDGVLASADILQELAWLGALDDRLAIGTMNRGGVIGATWELDDRMTAYDPAHIEAHGLDGGKTLLRVDHSNPSVARTIEAVALATTQLADRGLISMIEALPYTTTADGVAVLDPSDEALVKVVGIASGLGASSAYTWLKVPPTDRMTEVAGATTLPMLMLGGDPGRDRGPLFTQWQDAMHIPNVRGLVAGRALLYPFDDDIPAAIERAVAIVHPAADSIPSGGTS